MFEVHPSFQRTDQDDFAHHLSIWVSKRIEHEGSIFGLPPVPTESNPPDACYQFANYPLSPGELAEGVVDLVLWMAREEAGKWLKTTIKREGFVPLHPFLEGRDLFSVIAETRSKVERSGIVTESVADCQ
jgi:hypothetical protein